MLPLSVLNGAFVALTVVTLYAFYRLTGRRRLVLIVGGLWLFGTGALAGSGFFLVTDTLPPRLGVLLLPALIAGLLIGFGRWGRGLRQDAHLAGLHYFFGIRILVEIIFLHGLYRVGYVAREMTYEGLNYDLMMGMLLPLTGYLVFHRRLLSRRWAVAANLLGILVLTWTVVVANLSAPTPIQQFGFEQPTIAIFYFPFIWLPALVAPLMFWVHFIVLKLLVRPLDR